VGTFMSVLEGELNSAACTNATGSGAAWMDMLGMTQDVRAHGAPQVAIMAQPLNAMPTGPNSTHETNTMATTRRRRVIRLTSAVLARRRSGDLIMPAQKPSIT
jgi:hypothetical protein